MARGYVCIYRKMSPKHPQRYVTEFEGRHNQRDDNNAEQMAQVTREWLDSGLATKT